MTHRTITPSHFYSLGYSVLMSVVCNCTSTIGLMMIYLTPAKDDADVLKSKVKLNLSCTLKSDPIAPVTDCAAAAFTSTLCDRANLLLCIKTSPVVLDAKRLLSSFWLSFRLRPVPVGRGPPERHLARIWEDHGLLHAPQWGKYSYHELHAIKARLETERGELSERLSHLHIRCQALIPAGLPCTSSSQAFPESFYFLGRILRR